ncbi:MAG: hypothetical protein IPK58_12455 [Acidobacteria bacterium]|nr:hypothetical protein [Acidobacteriota bacterium]
MKFGLVVFVIMASMSVAKSQSPENQDLQLSISSAEVSVCSLENFVVKVNAKNVGEKPLVIDSGYSGRSFEATWSKNWKDGGSFGSKQLFRVVELGGSDPRLVTLNPGQSITVNRSLRFDDYDLEIGLKYTLESNFRDTRRQGNNIWTGSVYSNAITVRIKKCSKRRLPANKER